MGIITRIVINVIKRFGQYKCLVLMLMINEIDIRCISHVQKYNLENAVSC